MALRDLFDNDPRSKEQLREEIRLNKQLISDLSTQLANLGEQSTANSSEAASLRGQLQSEKLRTKALIDELSEIKTAADTSPTAEVNATAASSQRRIESTADLCGKTWQRTIDGLFNISTCEFIPNEHLFQKPSGLPGYSLSPPTDQTFFIPQSDVNENVVAYETDNLNELSLTTPVNADKSEQLEKTVAYLRRELEKAKTVIQSFPPFGIKQVNQPSVSSGGLERMTHLLKQKEIEESRLKVENDQLQRELASLRAIHRAETDLMANNKNLVADNWELRQKLANWTSSYAEREAHLSKLAGITPPKLPSNRNHLPFSASIPTFMHDEILAWMFSETYPDDLQVGHGYLHLMGEGPWDNNAFGLLMEGQDFSLWQLPDADIAHLVVGRNNWDESGLNSQIAARRGQELRIYSQEMWFAAMATGRDPFDAKDPALLQAFANGHPALEYLSGQEIPWPEVTKHPPEGPVIEIGDEDLGVEASPMHLMDYRVGKTSPHSEEERRAILHEIFCTKDLPFGDDCSDAYRSRWGAPHSAQRLYRMASHIKHIVDGPNGNDYRRPMAREDWISDLGWLKKTYFRKSVHPFTWPGTMVP